MTTPRLHVPIGIPGSGKTTWAAAVLEGPDTVRISTDDIRARLHPDEDFVSSLNKQVFGEFHDRIRNTLSQGISVIADATNLHNFARATLLEIGGRTDATVHYIVFTNMSQAIVRNFHRERVVEVAPMLRLISQYETALRDIPTESYDVITYIAQT